MIYIKGAELIKNDQKSFDQFYTLHLQFGLKTLHSFWEYILVLFINYVQQLGGRGLTLWHLHT